MAEKRVTGERCPAVEVAICFKQAIQQPHRNSMYACVHILRLPFLMMFAYLLQLDIYLYLLTGLEYDMAGQDLFS